MSLIKVLIVDDSALIRSILTEIVRSDPQLLLVGAAPNAYVAKDLVIQFQPDVITLDIEMPKVDGLTFLDRLMKAKPTPVVMISSLTEQGVDITLRALELGAVDYIAKPKLGIREGMEAYRTEIIDKIKSAAKANIKARQLSTPHLSRVQQSFLTSEKILAIGASTGGTEAIKDLLLQLPADCPAILITQHMPPGFTRSFAARLNKLCAMKVREATQHERILPGHAYLAPGDKHLTIVRSGADYQILLDDRPRVSGHKPSVDVMLTAIAEQAGANAVAVILTGMGRDGAIGIQAIAAHGGYCIAQDEQSSVIFGMPKEAIKTGVVHQVLPLAELGGALAQVFNQIGKNYRT